MVSSIPWLFDAFLSGTWPIANPGAHAINKLRN